MLKFSFEDVPLGGTWDCAEVHPPLEPQETETLDNIVIPPFWEVTNRISKGSNNWADTSKEKNKENIKNQISFFRNRIVAMWFNVSNSLYIN